MRLCIICMTYIFRYILHLVMDEDMIVSGTALKQLEDSSIDVFSETTEGKTVYCILFYRSACGGGHQSFVGSIDGRRTAKTTNVFIHPSQRRNKEEKGRRDKNLLLFMS